MQQSAIRLTPAKVSASFSDHRLTVVAEGHEDGVNNIRIVESPTPIVPLTFLVEGDPSPAIGMFPYRVERHFPLESDPELIVIQTQVGPKRVPVHRG